MREFDDAALGAALRAIEAPASQPDIGALVAAGRRRDRRRRAATAAGVFVAIAVATAVATLVVHLRQPVRPVTPSPTLTSCVAGPRTPLPAPRAQIFGVDPTGRFAVGTFSNEPGDPLILQGAIWDHGVTHQVDPLAGPGLAQVTLTDVNASGWAVGRMERWITQPPQELPVQYRNGRLTLLPLPDGVTEGDAAAINARGDIVGSGQRDGGGIPLLWPADAPGTVTVLPLPDGHQSGVATTITDADAIGGNLIDGADIHPYYWASPSSPGVQLRPPERSTGGMVAQVRGDYAIGAVAYQPGGLSNPSSPSFATEWDLRTGTVWVAEDPPNAKVVAVDAAGAYVTIVYRAGGRYDAAAYVVQPGRPTIAVPVPAGSTGVSPRIIAISDDGHRLTGQLYDESGVSASGLITWTCS